MKYILLAFLLMPLNASAVEFDKFQHYAVSVVLSESFTMYLKDRGVKNPRSKAIMLTIGVGIAKEIHDPVFDKQDLLYDILGAVTPAILHWEF